MTKDQIKDWGHFYLQLALTGAWNALCQAAGVAVGAAGAQLSGTVDLTKLGLSGGLAVVLGTIITNVGLQLYANRIPPPNPPAP